MNKSESIKELASALCKFQEEVKNPSNSARNPLFNSKYAPLDVVINAVKPYMAKNGLSFIQSTGSEGENITITTLLLHKSGEFLESDPLILPGHQIGKGGVKKDFNAQGAGSAITYGRRYSLSAILGISSEDDEDGNGASHHTHSNEQFSPQSASNYSGNTNTSNTETTSDKASEKQVKMIFSLIPQVAEAKGLTVEVTKETLKKRVGISSLEHVTKSQASAAIKILQDLKTPANV